MKQELTPRERAEISKRVMEEFPYPKNACANRRSKIDGLRHRFKRQYENEALLKKKEYK